MAAVALFFVPHATATTTTPSASSPGDLFPQWASEWMSERDEGNLLSEVFSLAKLVRSHNACALPGCTIKYEEFIPRLWRATSLGFILPEVARYVAEALRWGFDLGSQRDPLRRGGRRFANYDTALNPEAMPQVIKAIGKRLRDQKSISLGAFDSKVWGHLKEVFVDVFIFPLGAREKPLEPGVLRLIDDHTRTGFNAATVMGLLGHTLDTYREIAHYLKHGWVMHVTDVDNAFPSLPLAPWIWPFMMFKFPCSADGVQTDTEHLFLHTCAGFGSRGAPGSFKLFFVDCVVNMARAEGYLQVPTPVCSSTIVEPSLHMWRELSERYAISKTFARFWECISRHSRIEWQLQSSSCWGYGGTLLLAPSRYPTPKFCSMSSCSWNALLAKRSPCVSVRAWRGECIARHLRCHLWLPAC